MSTLLERVEKEIGIPKGYSIKTPEEALKLMKFFIPESLYAENGNVVQLRWGPMDPSFDVARRAVPERIAKKLLELQEEGTISAKQAKEKAVPEPSEPTFPIPLHHEDDRISLIQRGHEDFELSFDGKEIDVFKSEAEAAEAISSLLKQLEEDE